MSPDVPAVPFLPADRFQLLYWVDQFRSLPTLTLVLAVAAGIICLLYGRTLFRFVVILNAMILAGWAGWQLGVEVGRPYLVAIGLGVIFGLLAWPLFKLGVAILCGLAGAALGVQIVSIVSPNAEYWWPVAGVLGFIGFAIVGLLLVMFAVTVFTAMEGSTLIVLAFLVLVERGGVAIREISWLPLNHVGAVHAAILILGLIGILYQLGLGHPAAESPPSPPPATPAGKA